MKRFTLLLTALCLCIFGISNNHDVLLTSSSISQIQSGSSSIQPRDTYIDQQLMVFITAIMEKSEPQRTLINEIVKDVASWVSDEKIQSAQVSMKPVDYQLGKIINYHVPEAEKALKAAIKQAEHINCSAGLRAIKAMETKLRQIDTYYRTARSSLVYFTTYPANSNLKPHLKSFQDNYNLALQTSVSLKEEIVVYDKNPCGSEGGSSISSPTPTQTQAQTSTPPSSSLTTLYPTFTGPYAGDNLLLLFGRKLDDPAIQQLLNDTTCGFKELTVRPKPGEKTYYASELRMGLKFKEGTLVRMSFSSSLSYKPENHFKQALPLAIPFTKSSAGMKSLPDDWRFMNLGGSDQWNLKKYGLSFSVMGDPKQKIVTLIEIEAKDVKDWNGYYGQF